MLLTTTTLLLARVIYALSTRGHFRTQAQLESILSSSFPPSSPSDLLASSFLTSQPLPAFWSSPLLVSLRSSYSAANGESPGESPLSSLREHSGFCAPEHPAYQGPVRFLLPVAAAGSGPGTPRVCGELEFRIRGPQVLIPSFLSMSSCARPIRSAWPARLAWLALR